MSLFEYILILLAAICLSNLVNRFVPVLSVPVVQIALGAVIAFLPLRFQLELDPNLFFVLFIAPLIFHISMMADKKTMWAQRKPILNSGIIMVFVIVVVVGYLLNFLIPSIPLAAAFALTAALVPTDDVAVTSVGKRTNVPPKILSLLQGESIINDASGIVSFQFALAVMLTGSFSIVQATGRFFVVALGGIAVGLLLSWFKYLIVRWIRSLGIGNVTLHLLLVLLTPFVIFLIAEELKVSSILAIFAAGIAHSFNRDKFNPEKVNYNIASESVWSMFSFTLEGLVFVIMGTQLPKILLSINQNYSIPHWKIVTDILLITLLFLFFRFVWSIVFIKKKSYEDVKHPVSKFRAGIIFSLSGARGAITLASVMSIPFFLNDGSTFPERDLIILIAGSVIVISLLITSFILPLCIEKKTDDKKYAENEAYLEILQNVIDKLQRRISPENEAAIAIVISNYRNRSIELQRRQNNYPFDREEERNLRIRICEWEKGNITELLKQGKTDEWAAKYCMEIIDKQLDKLLKHRFVFKRNLLHFLHYTHYITENRQHAVLHANVFTLIKNNLMYVIEKLKRLTLSDDNSITRKIITEYEIKLSMYQRSFRRNKPDNKLLSAVVSYAFQTERENIQSMFDAGRISRETARDMRHNISLLEVQLKKNHF